MAKIMECRVNAVMVSYRDFILGWERIAKNRDVGVHPVAILSIMV